MSNKKRKREVTDTDVATISTDQTEGYKKLKERLKKLQNRLQDRGNRLKRVEDEVEKLKAIHSRDVEEIALLKEQAKKHATEFSRMQSYLEREHKKEIRKLKKSREAKQENKDQSEKHISQISRIKSDLKRKHKKKIRKLQKALEAQQQNKEQETPDNFSQAITKQPQEPIRIIQNQRSVFWKEAETTNQLQEVGAAIRLRFLAKASRQGKLESRCSKKLVAQGNLAAHGARGATDSILPHSSLLNHTGWLEKAFSQTYGCTPAEYQASSPISRRIIDLETTVKATKTRCICDHCKSLRLLHQNLAHSLRRVYGSSAADKEKHTWECRLKVLDDLTEIVRNFSVFCSSSPKHDRLMKAQSTVATFEKASQIIETLTLREVTEISEVENPSPDSSDEVSSHESDPNIKTKATSNIEEGSRNNELDESSSSGLSKKVEGDSSADECSDSEEESEGEGDSDRGDNEYFPVLPVLPEVEASSGRQSRYSLRPRTAVYYGW